MKLKYVFYLQGVALVVTALIWIFAPAAFFSTGGLTTTDPGWLLFGRNTGALLAGLAPMAFAAGHASDSPLRRQLLLSFFLLHSISLAVHGIDWLFTGASFGDGMALGLHVVFALGFGYFQFIAKETHRTLAPSSGN